MDRIDSTGTIWIGFKYYDTDDWTVIPAQVNYSFYLAFRQGVGSIYGPNQDLAVEMIDNATVQAFDC